ncbi:vomeronasal type-2 receptor 26-like [Bombina bombina]|uniref:vomeronasal type-2 receptor 26-like n=1 Tax=Bombina bombina TaxID=8345 RepID=UPI00235B2D8D|nr:vomeronasal type-2 receptor 26-like [Bombina bombina]
MPSEFELDDYLKNVYFKTTSGEEIFFNEKGYVPGRFDIFNWVIHTNGTIKKTIIGSFSSIDHKYLIYDNAITWNPYFNQTPTSICSEICSSGHRKIPQTGKPSCCFYCVPCSDGEIANSSGMENCEKCPEDHWSNPARNECIRRTIDFLSYEDTLGMSLACFASLFLLITIVVLWIFIKHRDTPIVRVNNRNLTYILLVALILSYVCTFLFIGKPVQLLCRLRQPTFGFVSTVAISAILGKTMTVVIAFNATKPGSKLKKLMGSKMSTALVFVCSLGELVICFTWLSCYPPFVDIDIKTSPGSIILLCNEGHVIAFFLVVSYVGILALFSFIIAFLARKLPDSFNESKYITFSMLVFCSIWVSFIPSYLSTKGKYVIAVEIFSILASTSGVLLCIFAPKCYIIILKPQLNSRAQINVKKQSK